MTLDQTESYTIEGTVDELYLCLARKRSYSKQAFDLMYKIPRDRPAPVFIIKIKDLNLQVVKELNDRWQYKKEINYILKQAVGRIFENINEQYFLLSVKRLLRVVLV